MFMFVAALLIAACSSEDTYQPKPKGFNRFDIPQVKYHASPDSLPYSFEISDYAVILKDTHWTAEDNWIDLYYPQFQANIQLTYKPLGKSNSEKLNELINDSYRLKDGHNKKATAVDESFIRTPYGYPATIFELEGEVPSQLQFFTTDSSSNFLRGAVYFRSGIHNDSLAPAIAFMKEDVMHLLKTLKFKQ